MGGAPELASVMGRKLPTINAGLHIVSIGELIGKLNSHVPHITFHCEGEATSYLWIFRVGIRILQRTARKNCFLSVVEGDGAKLLPVGYQ